MFKNKNNIFIFCFTIVISFSILNLKAQITVDFESGLPPGWDVTGGTTSIGTFVVADPSMQTATGIVTQPEDDTTPLGTNALFTATNTSAVNGDVDGGVVTVTSETFSITQPSSLSLNYFHGQRDGGDDPAGDFFRIEVSLNGGSTFPQTLVSIGDVPTEANWFPVTLNSIPSGSDLVIRVSVSDGVGATDIIEGGIDDIVITPETDTDGDGIPDNIDEDIDNDGISNCEDNQAQDSDISKLFSINGDAEQDPTNPLRAIITPNINSQAGSITINDRINFSESFNFEFRAFLGDNDGGADGVAIIFHSDPNGANAVGVAGNGLGAREIENGIVLELDTFFNGDNAANGFGVDIPADHGTIWLSETQANLSDPIGLPNLEDNTEHTINLIWNATTTTLEYRVDGDLAGRIINDLVTNVFGTNLVFFGFTGSTGGFSNLHAIEFDDLCDVPLFIDSDQDGIPNLLDLDSDNDGILDVVEGGDGALDTDNDGRVDLSFADTSPNDGQADASVPISPNIEDPDTENDLIPDFIDPDSDNDGCLDAIEANGGFTPLNIITNTIEQLDGLQDANGIPLLVSPTGQSFNTAVITVANTTVNSQPINILAIAGNTASFSINAIGNGAITYQWQQRLSPTSPWVDLVNGGVNPVINGVTTSSLSLANIPLSLNGSEYRVRYINRNNLCVENDSDTGLLTVRVGSVITNRRITYRIKK